MIILLNLSKQWQNIYLDNFQTLLILLIICFFYDILHYSLWTHDKSDKKINLVVIRGPPLIKLPGSLSKGKQLVMDTPS